MALSERKSARALFFIESREEFARGLVERAFASSDGDIGLAFLRLPLWRPEPGLIKGYLLVLDVPPYCLNPGVKELLGRLPPLPSGLFEGAVLAVRDLENVTHQLLPWNTMPLSSLLVYITAQCQAAPDCQQEERTWTNSQKCMCFCE